MWKPLSIVSGLLLVAAGGIMYAVVRPEFKAEVAQAEASIKNLALAKTNQNESNAAAKAAENDLAASINLLAKMTAEKEKAKAEKAVAVKKVEDANKEKMDKEKLLADLQAELDGLGGLDQVVADLKALEAKKAQLEADKKNTIDATSALVAHKEATDKVITALKLREIYQKTGTVKEGTSSRITEVSPEYGFFVLAHGNSANITKNSKWDVVRDNTIIAKLVVTHIEQSRAVAELVPGTLVQGNQVLPGDRVVVSASSTPRALNASITAASKAGSTKKDAAKPADGTTPPPAENAVPDPFNSGTPAPAPAPAPTEEKPATDPAAPPAEAPAPAPENKPANP